MHLYFYAFRFNILWTLFLYNESCDPKHFVPAAGFLYPSPVHLHIFVAGLLLLGLPDAAILPFKPACQRELACNFGCKSLHHSTSALHKSQSANNDHRTTHYALPVLYTRLHRFFKKFRNYILGVSFYLVLNFVVNGASTALQ